MLRVILLHLQLYHEHWTKSEIMMFCDCVDLARRSLRKLKTMRFEPVKCRFTGQNIDHSTIGPDNDLLFLQGIIMENSECTHANIRIHAA